MSRIIHIGLVLVVVGLPQSVAVQPPAPSVRIGSVELRLNMRRDEVMFLLAPSYTVSADGFVMTKKGPPFDAVGSVGFSDAGLLRYVSKDWGPANQQEGVATVESLFGALSQIAKPSTTRVGNTAVQMCACTVFLYTTYSTGGKIKTVEIWDGSKTISATVVRGSAIPGGAAASVDERIGSTK